MLFRCVLHSLWALSDHFGSVLPESIFFFGQLQRTFSAGGPRRRRHVLGHDISNFCSYPQFESVKPNILFEIICFRPIGKLFVVLVCIQSALSNCKVRTL